MMNEHHLSQIWQAQWLRRDALRITDGRGVRVVYRGRWSFGLGPDFQEALLVFDDGPLLRGDIEVHLRAADWRAHAHERDERYASVILHVTLDPAPAECRRPDGTLVPHLPLANCLPGPPEHFIPSQAPPLGIPDLLDCAGHLLAATPERLTVIVREAGYARLEAKAARAEAAGEHQGAAQALYADLLDGLGYSQNRAPFRELAARLPLALLDDHTGRRPPAHARLRLAALLLGAAGFLPWREPAGLRLTAAVVAGLEADWERLGGAWRAPAFLPLTWDLARLRPANHPARRLLGLATLLATHGPVALPAIYRDLIARDSSAHGLIALLSASLWPDAAHDGHALALIGAERARELAINVVIPHTLAHAAATRDQALTAAARRAAASLPAGAGNTRTRAMLRQLGGSPRPRTAVEEQGLLHLDTSWCATRRCYECPVAAAAARQQHQSTP